MEKEEYLKMIAKNPKCWMNIPIELQNDKKFALEAISKNKYIYEYLSDILKNDLDIGLKLIYNSSFNIEMLTENLRGNKTIVLTALTSFDPYLYTDGFEEMEMQLNQNYDPGKETYIRILSFATENLKNDRDFGEQVVRFRAYLYQFLGSKLKQNPEFLHFVKNTIEEENSLKR